MRVLHIYCIHLSLGIQSNRDCLVFLFKLLILKIRPHAQINVSLYRLTQKNLLKVSKELDQDQAKPLGWNELLATISKLGGEVEAVSRSAQQSNRDVEQLTIS